MELLWGLQSVWVRVGVPRPHVERTFDGWLQVLVQPSVKWRASTPHWGRLGRTTARTNHVDTIDGDDRRERESQEKGTHHLELVRQGVFVLCGLLFVDLWGII